MNPYTSLGCPCGSGLTKITSTTLARSGKDVRRARVCPKCSEGFVTYEVNAKDYALLQAIRKAIEDANDQIHDSGRIADPSDDR